MCAERNQKAEKEFILEFIEVYKSLTSLWKSENDKDRLKRKEESNILLEKYRERYPEANKHDVSKKINVLRSNFHRELRRLNDLSKSSAEANDANISRLWYFDALSFIQDAATAHKLKSNVLKIEDEAQENTTKSLSATDNLVFLPSQRSKKERIADKIQKKEKREFLLEFIEVYRSLTSLWDVQSEHYKDRQKREEENDTLLEKYQERYPEASKKDMRRKINELRSNFHRELKRLNDLNNTSAGVNDSHISSLWYFDALSFIQDVETPRKSRSKSLEVEDEPQQKKTKKTLSTINDFVPLVPQRLEEKRSAYKAASEVWALKLENMDPNQAVVAEKMINDIIYEAQLGRLKPSCTLTPRTTCTPHYHTTSSSSSEIDMAQSAYSHSKARRLRPSSTQLTFVQQSSTSEQTEEEYIVAEEKIKIEL